MAVELAKEHPTVTPKELFHLLNVAIAGHEPCCLVGPPGCGKSDLMSQVCKYLGADLVTFHPVVDSPTDYKGLGGFYTTLEGEKKARWFPYGNLELLTRAEKLTIAFFDDAGQAPAANQAAIMQLVLTGKIGDFQASEKVVFMLATNGREHNAGVSTFLRPLKGRTSIFHMGISQPEWCEWAAGNGVFPEVLSYIRFKPEMLDPSLFVDTDKRKKLMDKANAKDMANMFNPRNVVRAGFWAANGLRTIPAFASRCGDFWATDFLTFLRYFDDLPSIDGILADPEKAIVPERKDVLYAVATAVAARTTKENAGRVLQYAGRLPGKDGKYGEFGVLLVRDALRRCPEMANTKAFVNWARDNQDLVV